MLDIGNNINIGEREQVQVDYPATKPTISRPKFQDC